MEKLEPKFPPHLLGASLAERLRYFQRELVLNHSRLDELASELGAAIAYPTDRNLILVVGPTGVGKSALLRHVNRKCNVGVGGANGSPALGGSIYVELAAPKRGRYDFGDLHMKSLEALGTVMPEKSRPLVLREAGTRSLQTLLLERRSPELTTRGIDLRFKKEVSGHQLRAVICDEARSIFKISSTANEDRRMQLLREQGDVLKDLANELRTSFVLGGAYDFFDVALTNGQTARRSRVVHFAPYDLDREADEYMAGAMGLLSQLPIELMLDPTEAVVETAPQSLGCIGTTSAIFAEAMKTAHSKGIPFDMTLLRQHFYPAVALHTMKEEQEKGVARVTAFLTLGDVMKVASDAGEQAAPVPRRQGRKPVRPGDTSPSRREESQQKW